MSSMESWRLEHPDYGVIEVRSGFDEDFFAVDSKWPGKPGDEGTETGELGVRASIDASLPTRVRTSLSNPPLRLEVLVDGEVQHQFDTIDSTTLPLFGPGTTGKLRTPMSLGIDRAKPHLRIRANAFKDLMQIEFREGPTVVEFDPPPGSRGAKRREAMASSDFKRTAIPMLEGLGKGGWALAVLFLGPVVARVLAWLRELLPDWQLPEIRPPHVDLPVPELPQVNLPVPNWSLPEINLPELPAWVAWLAEYGKIWVPVLIGVVVGIAALRNHRKSEREKAAWAQREDAAAETASSSPPQP